MNYRTGLKWPEPPPVCVVIVPKLWPRNTVERVSFRTVRWSKEHLPITVTLLAHALGHVMQRERLGWRYLPLYIWYWILAGGRHDRHRMENEARAAERADWYRAWAAYLIKEGTWIYVPRFRGA